MINLPNLISLFRIPLALLFFIPSSALRLTLLAIAMLTDGLDGYIARRYGLQTRLGAILDPLTDKFFVLVALFVYYKDPLADRVISPWQIGAFFSRDIALFLFTLRAFFMGPFFSTRSNRFGRVK